MEQIKISLILPIYNIEEEYLRKCINTLINQTLHEIEIILINDGSKLETKKICDEFPKLDKRINVIHQENQGVSVARNVGIKKSKGEWIAFVDPDDFVELDMCEKLYTSVQNKKNEVDIIFCDSYVECLDKTIENQFYNKKTISKLDIEKLQLQIIYKRINNYYPKVLDIGVPWAKLYRASFIKKNNLKFIPKMIRMQDGIFNLEAFEKAQNIYYLPMKLYHYRVQNNSVTNKYSPNTIKYCEKHFEEIEKFIKKYNKSQIFNDALNLRIVSRLEYYMSSYFFNKNNKEKYKIKKQEINDLISNPKYKKPFTLVKKEYLHPYMYIVAFLLVKHQYFMVHLLTKIKSLLKK